MKRNLIFREPVCHRGGGASVDDSDVQPESDSEGDPGVSEAEDSSASEGSSDYEPSDR